jgi:tetratricopeptide (TPR) repeat protein
MTVKARRLSRALVALALSATQAVSVAAAAQDADSSVRDAGKHFQRGVALYGEADYRAALVEFKRAYAQSPNVAVLYNVGETEFQLQDYAAALTTFRRYLAEAAPTEVHHAEVENNVEVLRSRVGHLNITTVPGGADITIDDQLIGKTPLDEAVLVSIGHRKVTASMAGRQPVVRYVDVAAEDNVAVTLPFAASAGAPGDEGTLRASLTADSSPPSHLGPTLRIAGWVATGVLAGGALTFGLLAEKAGSDLKNARNTYPTTASTLNHDASVATTYSIVADSLTVAAIVVGGITLYSTFSSASSSSSPPARGASSGARVMLGPASARFDMTF